MQPALKTRLIGAFVLIALAVIVIPMFFSGEPSGGAGHSISLAIPPPPDQALETRTLSVAPPSSASTRAAIGTQAIGNDQLATVNAPSRVPPAVNPVPTPAPHATSPTATAATAATASASARAPAPASRPVPAAQPPADARPGRAAHDRYLISLGAYADKANAKRLVAKVDELGYAAKISGVSIDGKPAARVDAGPFASRAAAEAARLKLHAALPRAPAKLVSAPTDQRGNAPATALPKDRAGGWAVQVIAYAKRSDADQLRDRLRKAGFASYVDDVVAGGKTLWRVRVGPLAQRSDALAMLGRIKDKFPRLKGVVVTVP